MSDDITATDARIDEEYKRIFEARDRILKLRKGRPPEPVDDYEFHTLDGPVKLSGLFGDKPDLLVVHNMGRSCPMCTLWADGFNGVLRHLENRTAFVVSSPDEPGEQREFAESRGWRFRMVSTAGSTFAKDLGYEDDKGQPWPGVSAFQRNEDGAPIRVGHAGFGPFDDFSPMFNLMTLFPEGQNDWWPKLSY